MPLGIDITATGPLFGTSGGVVQTPAAFALDGAARELDRAVSEAVDDLARMGTQRLFQQGQPRPAGIFLSVAEARPGHESKGGWRAHLINTTSHLQATIAPGVIYGNWLEGESSRNASSRFKGYAMFRKTGQWLQEQAPDVMQKRVDEALARLNG